jgi:hypothetical protein
MPAHLAYAFEGILKTLSQILQKANLDPIQYQAHHCHEAKRTSETYLNPRSLLATTGQADRSAQCAIVSYLHHLLQAFDTTFFQA